MEIEKPDPVLEALLEEANVNYAQREEFRHDPPRAIALLEHALSRKRIDKPAAYALSRFRKGQWPQRTNRGTGKPSSSYEVASRMIHGYGWDESYDRATMLEEIERVYDRRQERLRPADRERLLSAWQAESIRRYPPTPIDAAELEAIRAELADEFPQLELLDA